MVVVVVCEVRRRGRCLCLVNEAHLWSLYLWQNIPLCLPTMHTSCTYSVTPKEKKNRRTRCSQRRKSYGERRRRRVGGGRYHQFGERRRAFELIPATKYKFFCRTFNFRTKWPHSALFEDDATEESYHTYICVRCRFFSSWCAQSKNNTHDERLEYVAWDEVLIRGKLRWKCFLSGRMVYNAFTGIEQGKAFKCIILFVALLVAIACNLVRKCNIFCRNSKWRLMNKAQALPI